MKSLSRKKAKIKPDLPKFNKQPQVTQPKVVEPSSEISERINQLSKDFEKLEQKTSIQLEEELYLYMEIDNPNQFHKKLIGFSLPYNNPEKFNLKTNKRIKEINEIINEKSAALNKQKLLEKELKKEINYKEKTKKFLKVNEQLYKHCIQKGSKKNYLQLSQNKQEFEINTENQISWDKIMKMDFFEIMLNNDYEKKHANPNIKEIFDKKLNNINEDDKEFYDHYCKSIKQNPIITDSNIDKIKLSNNYNQGYRGIKTIENKKHYGRKFYY